MAEITAFWELVATFTIEVSQQVYYRVEILRVDNGAAVQTTKFCSEVYLLKWPHGATVSAGKEYDTQCRQSWLYLEDFPQLSDSSIEGLRDQVVDRLLVHANAYTAKFKTAMRRVQPE
jgi:hypothetical protein